MPSEPQDKAYAPRAVEDRWYAFWEQEGLFAAREGGEQPAYSIVIPPPNVTGVLHMGHALNITLQDILCRYRRLCGDNVLWMPGTDHAGIATQNVVEKKLAQEGRDRHQLGREAFISEVWKWRAQSGSAIINQLKRLGASCDWQRERFTMDEGLSRAVRQVFVQLHQEGLIYRGNYIINWCHRCHTALSDLEVEHEEIDGQLYQIRYPLADGSGSLTIATTRPETMLGDTAVAVNPEDERYRSLIGRQVLLPLMQRSIPVIQDRYVDMGFGTGALKVTPAHDPNDFEIGQRHALPVLKVIGDDGLMTAEAGTFVGQDRFHCRETVVKALKAEGLLEKIEPLRHSVGHCYRCKTLVEPNLSRQWFVRAKPLAEKAIAAVKDGRTRIIPEMWAATYFDWLNNIRDWCISRQIWWGHQIPAWTCASCGEMIVALETPKECKACGGELTQETDVLDTWFSSALWPFSTMGWPEHTPLLATFYPTAALVTGFDILFFWVARMMMMGLHFMGEVPFRDVYVHALVRDEEGRKMSKSKGNVIDPLTVMDAYGTDAFRFTLAAFAAQGRDIRMSEKRVEGYRHFVNKLWNAVRFALMHLEAPYPELPAPGSLSLADRWILSRLARVTASVEEALDSYRFNDAAGAVYGYFWHEVCDWYLEAAKPALFDKAGPAAREASRAVLYRILRDSLVLLHPFMPFVTEELWHKLPGTQGSILKASFPSSGTGKGMAIDDLAEEEMAMVSGAISAIRNIRGEMNIPPSLLLDVTVQSPDSARLQCFSQQGELIRELARLGNLAIQAPGPRPRAAATAVVAGATVFVSLEGIIDFARETQRLEKEIGKLIGERTQFSKKLANEDFLSKAPPEVVAKVQEKHAALLEKEEKLQANIERIRSIGAEETPC